MNERTRLTSREAPPMPDTFAQAMFRYLAGQIAEYLPAVFDPSPWERRMDDLKAEIEAVTKAQDDAEARAAANKAADDARHAAMEKEIADEKQQLADLQAKFDAGHATPEEIAALEALRARIEASNQPTGDVTPVTPVTDTPVEPVDTGVVTEPTDQPPA